MKKIYFEPTAEIVVCAEHDILNVSADDYGSWGGTWIDDGGEIQ